MMLVNRLLRRRPDDDADAPMLAAHPWDEGRATVGSKRPDGWRPEALILKRGVRAGVSPRTMPRVVQIRVDTQ